MRGIRRQGDVGSVLCRVLWASPRPPRYTEYFVEGTAKGRSATAFSLSSAVCRGGHYREFLPTVRIGFWRIFVNVGVFLRF